MYNIKKYIITAMLLYVASAWTDELNIKVVGLFNERAIVDVNGQQRLLQIGKPSLEGITLVSANSRKAVLEINGLQTEHFLAGNQAGSSFSPPVQAVVSLWLRYGRYYTPGMINGVNVDFVVDTGADTIALNSVTASRIGLNYLKGQPTMVATASEITTGYNIMLDKVKVDGITLYNIKATVLEGNQPETVLLGMTFLNQLDMIFSGDRLDLKKKF